MSIKAFEVDPGGWLGCGESNSVALGLTVSGGCLVFSKYPDIWGEKLTFIIVKCCFLSKYLDKNSQAERNSVALDLAISGGTFVLPNYLSDFGEKSQHLTELVSNVYFS